MDPERRASERGAHSRWPLDPVARLPLQIEPVSGVADRGVGLGYLCGVGVVGVVAGSGAGGELEAASRP